MDRYWLQEQLSNALHTVLCEAVATSWAGNEDSSASGPQGPFIVAIIFKSTGSNRALHLRQWVYEIATSFCCGLC